MSEEKERPQNYSKAEYGAQQKEIKETLENAGLDPDLSACGHAQADEFDEDE